MEDRIIEYKLILFNNLRNNLSFFENNLSKEEFIKKIKINERYYKQIEIKKFVNLRLDTLIDISNGLEISFIDMFSRNISIEKKLNNETLDFFIKNLAINLKKRRKSNSLTQTMFAKKLDISLRLYKSLETTLKISNSIYPNITLKTLFKISNALSTTIEVLLTK